MVRLKNTLDKYRLCFRKALLHTTTLENIARGTTDPEIDFVTWIKLGNKILSLILVSILATRWHHLH